MKVDVNLASKDPLKFIDSVIAHHKNENHHLIDYREVEEQSDEESNED